MMKVNSITVISAWWLTIAARDEWVGSGLASDLRVARMIRECRKAGIADSVSHLEDSDWLP